MSWHGFLNATGALGNGKRSLKGLASLRAARHSISNIPEYTSHLRLFCSSDSPPSMVMPIMIPLPPRVQSDQPYSSPYSECDSDRTSWMLGPKLPLSITTPGDAHGLARCLSRTVIRKLCQFGWCEPCPSGSLYNFMLQLAC